MVPVGEQGVPGWRTLSTPEPVMVNEPKPMGSTTDVFLPSLSLTSPVGGLV